ncbi:MAG: YegP family protein [Thermosynechococcaceae cyanobacterium]
MAKFQIYQDKAGEFRWRLRAGNHQIIATGGEGYKSKSDCKHGIELIQRDAASAEIEDQS